MPRSSATGLTPSIPAADLTPEDLVLKDDPKPREAQAPNGVTAGRERGRRLTGRVALMGMLAWVMMGLAIWHFTIFLPDRFWGGIVGAFVGSLVGAILVALIIYSVKVSCAADPRRDARPTSRSSCMRSRVR